MVISFFFEKNAVLSVMIKHFRLSLFCDAADLMNPHIMLGAFLTKTFPLIIRNRTDEFKILAAEKDPLFPFCVQYM